MPPTETREPNMSIRTKEILSRAQRMVPPMLEKFHKGQLGRVAVIGGSEDYTGAPYFSAMASARLGCDMSHVICTPAAGAVIKTYSPNLMVHPLMRQTPSGKEDNDIDPSHIAAGITAMLPRIHVLVIGPGLGRDPLMHATVARVLRAAREKEIPVVLDADALMLIQKDPELVRGYPGAVLTPNVVEFGKLCEALGVDADKAGEGESGEAASESARAYLEGLWDTGDGEKIDENESVGLAAAAGSAVTKECSRLAFLKKGRSLQASDLTDEVHAAFLNLFGEVDGDEGSKL
ncbi:unnamed protein product [Parascedosporium putredinis]|uniref:ATP-dependent (S)-NAD(P)H-hydrate dehydratase n=1 Tax=Parascedosporium putredinis TaxID=1442378 RepID=A0A9P1H6R5_9PEZI|nr:unnamed protein product [Parascedosporium putredinis]CAI7997791.1 unnamed protein product [Parascedosporium putredinis]